MNADAAAGIEGVEVAGSLGTGERPDRAAFRPSSPDEVHAVGDGENAAAGADELERGFR